MTTANNKPVIIPKSGQLKIYEEYHFFYFLFIESLINCMGVFFWSWKPYDVAIDGKTNHMTVTNQKTKEQVGIYLYYLIN